MHNSDIFLLFVQRPVGHHNRFGNSLIWMAKANSFCYRNNINNYLFLYAFEEYKDYFDSRLWFRHEIFETIKLDLYSKINIPCDSANLSKWIRLRQHDYEVQNNLNPYDWKNITKSFDEVGLICGPDLRLESDLAKKLFSEVQTTIIFEPYEYFDSLDLISTPDFSNLAPKKTLIDAANNWFKSSCASHKLEVKCNIGLHIRRGDYREWRNGEFFYSDNDWIDLIDLLHAKKCRIFIFSNEDLSFLNNIEEKFIVSRGSSFEDHVRLMKMDFIIGPPSTFTRTALAISSSIQENLKNVIEGLNKTKINELIDSF